MVQRGHHFAIVDEVDSILIDEARTPLIISGPTEDRSDFYRTIDLLVKELRPDPGQGHLRARRKAASGAPHRRRLRNHRGDAASAAGHLAGGSAGPLRPGQRLGGAPCSTQALRANILYQRDRDYIVRDGEIMLIDEFTGRMMRPGRSLSDGLCQPGHRGFMEEIGYPAGEPDPRLGHHPELLPPLRQAFGDDSARPPPRRRNSSNIYKMDTAEILHQPPSGA